MYAWRDGGTCPWVIIRGIFTVAADEEASEEGTRKPGKNHQMWRRGKVISMETGRKCGIKIKAISGKQMERKKK